MVGFPVGGEVAQVEGQIHGLTLTGQQVGGFAEGGQRLIFPMGAGSGEIKLGNLPAVGVTDVCDAGQYMDPGAQYADVGAADVELRVAEAVAEGEIGRHAEGVEIAVAHEDPLFVEGLVPGGSAVFGGGGEIPVGSGPAVGELAGGRHIAGENVGHGTAALGAGLGDQQHRVDAGNPVEKARIDDAAAVEQENEFVIVGGAEADGGLLVVADEIVALEVAAVAALTGLTAQHVDAGVGPGGLHIVLRDGPAQRNGTGVEKHIHQGFHRPQQADLLPPGGDEAVAGALPDGFVVAQPVFRGDLKAVAFKTLPDADTAALVDLAGADAALDGMRGAGAVERHRAGIQRQNLPVIFQKHDTLTGSLPGNG